MGRSTQTSPSKPDQETLHSCFAVGITIVDLTILLNPKILRASQGEVNQMLPPLTGGWDRKK